LTEAVIDTRQLRIFTAIYKTGSFTKAAELLHTSQPTVSEHLQNLEHSLRCRLFDRLGRGIHATAEADLLYPRALAILEDIDKLKDELAATGRRVSGELMIGASTIPGAYFLPEAAAAFKTAHPDVAFEIRIADSTAIVRAVAAGELLVGVVGAKSPGRGLIYEHYCQDELTLVAAPEVVSPGALSIGDLLKKPFLLREEGSGTRKHLEDALAKHRVSISQLAVVAVLGSTSAIKEAVKAGLGLAIVSRYAVAGDLDCGKLRQIDLPELDLHRDFYLVTAAKRSLPHHYQVFLDTLRHRESR
jgi:DNA-binding transcriptional LysR family regulator